MKQSAARIDLAAGRAEFSRLMTGVWQPAQGTA
jgi:hypothetical protein